jgi:putative toxin-antitoxin system antitoxin component (TIGR02293 family)
MANVTHSEAGKRKSEPSDSKSRRKPGKKIRVNAVPTKPRQQASEESAVVDMAIKVIGNKSDAMRWMGTPVRALGHATPVSLLLNRKGARAVIAVLERLEYGVL